MDCIEHMFPLDLPGSVSEPNIPDNSPPRFGVPVKSADHFHDVARLSDPFTSRYIVMQDTCGFAQIGLSPLA